MANIVETVAGDRRISLLNEEIVRQMAFGQRWQRILVNFRISIQGSANITTPELIVGICSGLNGAYKPTSVTASYGMVFPGNGQNLTYNAGPPAYYSASAINGCRYVTKVGSTVTYTNVTISNQITYFAQGTNTPTYTGIVFTRTALNTITITSANLVVTAASAQAGHTLNQLYRYSDTYLMTPSVLFPNISALTPSGQTSIVTTEVMDSAFIYWSSASTAVEISDWLITRIN